MRSEPEADVTSRQEPRDRRIGASDASGAMRRERNASQESESGAREAPHL